MRGGIRHRDADRLKREIEAADFDAVRRQVTEEELEAVRDRREDLEAQVERCRGLLERPRKLEPRADELAALATRRLRERGEREARDLEETLRRQRERIVEELDRHEGRYQQIAPEFDEEERRQLQANMRYRRTRLRPVRPRPGTGTGAHPGVLRGVGAPCRTGRPRVPLDGRQLTTWRGSWAERVHRRNDGPARKATRLESKGPWGSTRCRRGR